MDSFTHFFGFEAVLERVLDDDEEVLQGNVIRVQLASEFNAGFQNLKRGKKPSKGGLNE